MTNLLNVCFVPTSDVPEGSFIIRAHTPMSNLFSCLWFNEIDRFTPRDQLSFAYTYQKLTSMNPGKPLHLNMFKVSLTQLKLVKSEIKHSFLFTKIMTHYVKKKNRSGDRSQFIPWVFIFVGL